MIGIHNYLLFLVSGFLLNLTPGADTMYIISRSVSQGKRAGVFSAAGISSGSVVHTLLAAFGLSYVLSKSLFLFTTIKLIGVAYLVYLGIKMIGSKSNSHFEPLAPAQSRYGKIFVQGMITNVTNPKVALFFLAFLPQFVDSHVHSPIPFILLGMTFITTGFIWCVIISYFASLSTRKLRENPKIGIWLNRITGGVFILLGAKLLRAKVSH